MPKSKQSMEDYLEAVLMITEKKGSCRSIEVANKLGYSKPSVSIAVAKLRQEGYLEEKGKDSNLVLTETGMKIAKKMAERHRFFKDWLVHLGVDEEIAYEDACGIEHWLSEESFSKMREYITEKESKDHNGDLSFLQEKD
ncbi:MAG: metal-dependent transcriptional regulator [Eubacterium sp.]|nr:metal-dependent transcriptional regulator [Eubacterium sp.]